MHKTFNPSKRRTSEAGIKTLKSIEKESNTMMKLIPNLATVMTVAVLPLVAMTSLPQQAQAQDACTVYTVKAGDTLASIAQAAYGTFDYQTIFNANRNLITNPNTLEVATVLQLPCEDGSLPGAASAQQIIAEQDAVQESRASGTNAFEPPIKIVTGNGWEPFVGERLRGGGMLLRLATTSLNRAGNAREFNTSFVDDWAAHFDTLLPLGAFDVSVAWYIPDCSKLDLLSDRMKARCTEVDHSLPVYESVVGFYTLPGNDYETVRNFAELAGARICRPEGFFTYDLEEQGMIPPVVTMVQPKTINECFDFLLEDEVDIVPLEIVSVAGAAAELGIADQIVENPYLTSILSMSFVAHKTNPRGKVYLALINRGLTEMRESGEWYAIISDSLAEYTALTATN